MIWRGLKGSYFLPFSSLMKRNARSNKNRKTLPLIWRMWRLVGGLLVLCSRETFCDMYIGSILYNANDLRSYTVLIEQ